MKFVQLANSLKGSLAPVYLLEGEETYFRDHAVAAIRAACAIAQPAFNDVRIEGDSLKGEGLSSLPAQLRTLPFFDEKRLVRLYEYYPTEREWERVFKPYCAAPCASTVLVIVNTGAKKGCDIKRKSGVCYVDCGKESEETLARWLFGVARRMGLDLDADAASLMVRYCNSDAARMKTETEKCRLLLGHGGRITRETVQKYVAKDVEYKIFELTDAAARGNYSAFGEILHDLLQKGWDENAALASLTSYFRTLCELADLRGTDEEIMQTLNLKPYPLKKSREALARLGKDRVKELYLRLYTLSAEMRSGICSKSGALSTAVAKIFFG